MSGLRKRNGPGVNAVKMFGAFNTVHVPRAAASGSAAARVARLASRGARSRGARGSQQVERGRGRSASSARGERARCSHSVIL